MQLKSLFPVIATHALEPTCAFYERWFGFTRVFQSDWYIHLHASRAHDGSMIDAAPIELAFMSPDHDSIPEFARAPFDGRGSFITIEVDDVDTLHAELIAAGYAPLVPLRTEPWGQRHFILRDPAGGMLDVVHNVEPSPEYEAAYV